MSRRTIGLALAFTLVLGGSALAHGDLHEQIERVTQEIGREPKNAALYLKRGELLRVHEDFPAALADLDRAQALDPALPGVALSRGRTHLDAGRSREARASLDRAVTESGAAEAFVWRARALARLELRGPAIEDYARTLALAPRSAPEIYLERAELQVREQRLADALAGLETGIATLGPGGVLDGKALEVELAMGRTDAALARLERLTQGARRKESHLVRRAEILEAAGRHEEAAAAWRDASEALEALPPALRSNRAAAALAEKIRVALTRAHDGSKKDKRS